VAQIYYDQDADMSVLEGKTVAVIGYGSQGRGQSLCLKDSGVNVIIGARPGKSFEAAKADGMEVVDTEEAARRGDVIQILAQDHLQAEIYHKQVAPYLTAGKALLFSHGFNIHFSEQIEGLIVPPADVDVLMVAPKGPGPFVRRQYEEGKGVPALLAIHQDATGNAKAIGLGLRQSDRRHARCGLRNHLPRRNRNGPVRRAGLCCAAAPANWCAPVSRHWWTPATLRKWPTSSACTS
jgi:ketol-acid reductoisomerase